MTDEIKNVFLQFLVEKMSIKAFEQWLYATSELEKVMDDNDYLSLISIDFDDKFAFNHIHGIIEKYISFDEFLKFKFSMLLNDIIAHNENSQSAIEETYYLYCNGYKFFENLGLNYGLDIAVPDCATQRIDDMYPRIIDDAKQVLQWVEDDTIIFAEFMDTDSQK